MKGKEQDKMKKSGKPDTTMLDEIDYKIIQLLKENAKAKMQDIGQKVHLTGQAVSNRINRMEKMGIIKGYSVIVDRDINPDKVVAFVTVHMKSTDHAGFQKWCRRREEIIESHRISGEGCYLLKTETVSQEDLNNLLDEILTYANYSVSISINHIK